MRDFGPASDRVLQIPLRESVTVCILDLPHDLTEAEARKLAGIIEAFATPNTKAATDDPDAVRAGRG